MQDDKNLLLSNEQLSKNIQSHIVVVEACRVDPSKNKHPPKDNCSHGTGFAICGGFILTCFHTINETNAIYIRPSQSTLPVRAKVVYVDPSKDLAVLSSSANLQPVKFGSIPSLHVGQNIGIAGNLFGMSTAKGLVSVRFGTISGLSRDVSSFGLPRDLAEMSIFLGSGDSGCPVFNQKGEVVGMTLATATTFDKYAGAGFAILLDMNELINNFRNSIEQLKELLDACNE